MRLFDTEGIKTRACHCSQFQWQKRISHYSEQVNFIYQNILANLVFAKNQQRGIWWSEVRFSGVYSKCILLNKEQDDFQSSNLLEVDNIPLPAMRSIFDASFAWRRLQVAWCAYHFIFVLESSWTHRALIDGHITNSLKWDLFDNIQTGVFNKNWCKAFPWTLMEPTPL